MRDKTATHAIVRGVSSSLAACQLLHVPRQTFDLSLAERQHEDYVRALRSAGVAVRELASDSGLPDSTFVEDPALLFDEFAVLCRLGTSSREAEAALIAPEIARLRQVFQITTPGTLEGGDVLKVGRTLFVGQSSRTNRDGIEQLARIVRPFGYNIVPVKVAQSLHLKTAVTSPADGVLLANPAWLDITVFEGLEILAVPPAEPWGANTLPVNDRVLVAASAPQTAELLEARGLDARRIDISELQKAEAGLTCLSLLYVESNRPGSIA